MDPKISALADQLLASLKGSLSSAANTFLESNADVKGFIVAKLQRQAELTYEYLTASDADKPTIQQYSSVVYQTIRNTTLDVLKQAEASVMAEIMSALSMAGQFVLANLPTILALIPK